MIHRFPRRDTPIAENYVGRWSREAIVNPSLSIRCMFGGSARYRIDHGRVCVVDDRSYLVLNKGQVYDVEKPGLAPVESFCVFFPDAWVAQAFADHDGGRFTFRDHTRPHHVAVTPHLLHLREQLQSGRVEPIALEQQVLRLLERLFATEPLTVQRADRLAVKRRAARVDLDRRLNVARDYLHAHSADAPSIVDAAGAAGLSPFHLIRTFAQLFGCTPTAYVIRNRIETARHLLLHTNRRVIDVAYDVGYESHPSFSSLFKSHVGCSPQQFRRTFGSNRNIR